MFKLTLTLLIIAALIWFVVSYLAVIAGAVTVATLVYGTKIGLAMIANMPDHLS